METDCESRFTVMNNKEIDAELLKQISACDRSELFKTLVLNSEFEFNADTVSSHHGVTAVCKTPFGIFSALIPTDLNFGNEHIREQRGDLINKAVNQILDKRYEVY